LLTDKRTERYLKQSSCDRHFTVFTKKDKTFQRVHAGVN